MPDARKFVTSSGCMHFIALILRSHLTMAKRVFEGTSDTDSPCVPAPVTPSFEERPGVCTKISNTPTKSQKRRKRLQRVAILKSQSNVQAPPTVTNNTPAFTGGVFSRLDRIEYMVSCLFCSMVSQGVDQCMLPEQLPAMRAEATSFVPASERVTLQEWEPIPVSDLSGACSFTRHSMASQEQLENQEGSKDGELVEDHEVTSQSSSEECELASRRSGDGGPSSAMDLVSTAANFDEVVLAMFELCAEEDRLGPYSGMDATSRERAQQIRSELWDHFATLCRFRGMDPTPESLGTSAGCLPSMFSDSEPNLTEFTQILEDELSMM
jgi:hypothetical protein